MVSLDPLYTQIDVFPTFSPLVPDQPLKEPVSNPQLCGLLSELVSIQDRQTALIEDMLAAMTNPQRRRVVELGLWKISNPELSEYCKKAAKKLERVQADLLASITEEIESNYDLLLDNEFGLNEFVDRYGAKFIQINSLLQIMTQLGNAPDLKISHQEIQKDN